MTPAAVTLPAGRIWSLRSPTVRMKFVMAMSAAAERKIDRGDELGRLGAGAALQTTAECG